LVALGSACSDSGHAGAVPSRSSPGPAPQTYRAHGVSFDYPAGWKLGGFGATGNALFGERWITLLSLGRSDGIILAAAKNRSSPPVTAEKIKANLPSIAAQFRSVFRQNGGVLLAGPDTITMGGLPGFEVRGTTYSTNGTPVVSRRIYAFAGTTEYLVVCQNTRAKAMDVGRACDQMLRTFKVIHPVT
jgi:hypothetical protein